jgi:hypothetical protein
MAEEVIPVGCIDSTECIHEYGELDYIPTLPGNILFAAIFGVALVAQIYLGIRHKTWGYMTAMIGGCVLEIVGYIGRLMMHNDIFDNNAFIIYIVGLTIAPAFYSAAVYLCFSRIVALYGQGLPIVKARIITMVFIGGDFISLLLQSAGGAIASTADDQEGSDMGVNIMIAGLAVQVVVTSFFAACGIHLMWAIRKYPHKVISETTTFRRTNKCRFWLYGMLTSYQVYRKTMLTNPSNRHLNLRHPHPLHLPLRRALWRLRRPPCQR